MKQITVTLDLDDDQAWALAQFAKRLGWQDFRAKAVDDDEADDMRNAIHALQRGLSDAGFCPR
jgi:hypothetical protein